MKPWPPTKQQKVKSLAFAAKALGLYRTVDGMVVDHVLGEVMRDERARDQAKIKLLLATLEAVLGWLHWMVYPKMPKGSTHRAIIRKAERAIKKVKEDNA